MRVSYAELALGKVYVQMKSGDNFRGYMVDEDRDTYTFRNNLNKPKEFIVQRSDVLFLAERNPSGLKGNGSYTYISLKWFHPYDRMNSYNIYIKKNKGDKYEKVDTVISNSVHLNGLKGNTKYYIIVTGVDENGIETTPSNEIEVTTLNSPPFPPSGLKMTHLKTGETNAEWKAATDLDGFIAKYKIYKIKNNKKELSGETKDTVIKISEKTVIDKIHIIAVDNMGAESSIYYAIMLPLSFTPGVIFPLEKFGLMHNVGIGGMFSFSARNLFFYNFEGGIALGFYYMQGKNLQDEKNMQYNDFMLVPAYLYAGYNIGITAGVILKPVISFGGAYLDVKYFDRNRTIAEGRDMHMQIFELSFKAGISAEYRFENSLSITLGCEYGAIIKKTGLLHFILLNAGVSYSF